MPKPIPTFETWGSAEIVVRFYCGELYQVFKGRLLNQVDRAVDFVLSVLNRSVGTREFSVQAPVSYEIPPDVVLEAIVNAAAHRDYASAAAVQVSVFADRVEVWNPGELLPPLTPADLREPHRSMLRNPRLGEVLFLARYIEKYGTGTLMMIRKSREHALPEPDFVPGRGEFGVTIWRDWLTEEVLAGLSLNERQRAAIAHVKVRGSITNSEHQRLCGVPHRTAVRDLMGLGHLGLLEHQGRGRGALYVLRRKRAMNVPIVPSLPAGRAAEKRPTKRAAAFTSDERGHKGDKEHMILQAQQTEHERDKRDTALASAKPSRNLRELPASRESARGPCGGPQGHPSPPRAKRAD